MARYIALLRAVNVGGRGKLRMQELSETLEKAGYLNVQTVLASGNVLLDTTNIPSSKLAARLDTLLSEQHALKTDVMVRTPEEWAAMIDANPMPEAAATSPSAFGLMVMKSPFNAAAIASFVQSWTGPEQIVAGEGCLYIHYTQGMGNSKLKLPTSVGIGTVRNWNTVCKLLALGIVNSTNPCARG